MLIFFSTFLFVIFGLTYLNSFKKVEFGEKSIALNSGQVINKDVDSAEKKVDT